MTTKTMLGGVVSALLIAVLGTGVYARGKLLLCVYQLLINILIFCTLVMEPQASHQSYVKLWWILFINISKLKYFYRQIYKIWNLNLI